jgi:hypothetical protein
MANDTNTTVSFADRDHFMRRLPGSGVGHSGLPTSTAFRLSTLQLTLSLTEARIKARQPSNRASILPIKRHRRPGLVSADPEDADKNAELGLEERENELLDSETSESAEEQADEGDYDSEQELVETQSMYHE